MDCLERNWMPKFQLKIWRISYINFEPSTGNRMLGPTVFDKQIHTRSNKGHRVQSSRGITVSLVQKQRQKEVYCIQTGFLDFGEVRRAEIPVYLMLALLGSLKLM